MQLATKNPEDVVRLINSVTLRAWQDAKFADDLRDKPKATLSSIAREFGVSLAKEEAETFWTKIPVTPSGDMPSLDRGLRMGDTVTTITSDCCVYQTHGMPCGTVYCGMTIFGTPCAACSNYTC